MNLARVERASAGPVLSGRPDEPSPRPNGHRTRTPPGAAISPPPATRAPIWRDTIPVVGRPPAVWLLGAHGGAGVTTLAAMLGPAGDCGGRWPGGAARESPFVVIVAKETVIGLRAAHDLVRQYRCDLAGDVAELLGVITVAHRPGRVPKSLRLYRDKILLPLVPEDAGRWRVDWQEEWPLTAPDQLPVWTPTSAKPPKGRDPVEPVRVIGEEIIEFIKTRRAQRQEWTLR
jgi:hypothetical protein